MSNRYIGGVVTETTNVAQSPWSGSWTEQAAMQGFGSVLRITNSLRLRASASAYLSRTQVAPTNPRVFTYSFWVKPSLMASQTAPYLFEGYVNDLSRDNIYFGSGNKFGFGLYQSSVALASIETTQVFRDPSAWYHFVIAYDSTQSTASDRVKIYVNGVQITSFSTATYPPQNQTTYLNAANTGIIGRSNYGGGIALNTYYDGYLTEVNFVDGQALEPTAFGAINKETGVWAPIAYAGTYGLNGFHLDFKNATSTTTLGYDTSGNGNNWTTNNISLTAGSTYDWMIDSPSKIQGTGYGVGNYAVLNPLLSTSVTGYSLSNGNLSFTTSLTTSAGITFNIPNSGKWYWEGTVASLGTGVNLGVYDTTYQLVAGSNPAQSTVYGYGYDVTGVKLNNGSASYGASYTTNDVIGVAFDADAGTLVFYKNGASQGTAFTGLTGKTYSAYFAANTSTWNANFGQRPFAYTPPTGYQTLCTQNLPVATIYNGAAYMAATLYTGSGSATSISNTVNGVSFQPDLVWVKSRSAATEHKLVDSVRGATKTLTTINSNAETTVAGGITAFNATGFSAGTAAGYNNSGVTYVGWQWKAGGTAVTNTSGSITSQVSANATAGFSVVTYTGTGSSATVGHGLGTAPAMVIVKRRSSPGGDWYVWHTSVYTLYGASYYLALNATNAAGSDATVFNGNTTSTTFPVVTNTAVNGSGGTFVAYCFAAIAGYSAFGSYTGNGSADGPFVYTGFRPRYILVKNTTTLVNDWQIMDTSIDPYNVGTQTLYADLSSAELAVRSFDILSNGFKLRDSSGDQNGSGSTYIYAAFAENPFSVALAR